jgi:hypothetical protein
MLWHRLALALGGMTVSELKRRMSSEEFTNWIAFDQIEPFGDHRLEMLLGNLGANLIAADGATGVKPIDFMPVLKDLRPPQTPDEIWQVFDRLSKRFGS